MDASVLVHFTDRFGGISQAPYNDNNLAYHVGDNSLHVKQNRILTCKDLEIDVSGLVSMEQVHGTNITTLTRATASPVPKSDGLLTKEPRLALLVQTADCTPVLLHAPDVGVVGALHAGRAGAFEAIVPKALKKLKDEFGASMDALHVWLGPAIGACCYEIDGDVLAYAKANFGDFVHDKKLDIGGILLNQLRENGVKNIYHETICTACDERYFSYRRDGKTGRQGGIIMLRSSHG